jgi:hypothetical protein
MKTLVLLAVCVGALGFASPRADGDSRALWRTFFQRVIPAATRNFAPLRGAFNANTGNYALKASFDPRLVRDCMIFTTGADDTQAWQLRCQLVNYSGQAMGPATAQGQLTHDLASALPHFQLGKNLMGEPQWKDGKGTAVTIVFNGILITHGNTDI